MTTKLFRPQRGSLAVSMAEKRDVSSIRDIAVILGVEQRDVSIRYYCYDSRIAWDTYVVIVDGDAVGFTNGAL